MSDKVHFIYYNSLRLRVRRVNEDSVAARAVERAAETSLPSWAIAHGGDVCNSYGFPAETEIAVAVALPDGRCLVWVDRAPANKVSLAGTALAAPYPVCRYIRAMVDGRVGEDTRALVRPFLRRAIVAALEDLEPTCAA